MKKLKFAFVFLSLILISQVFVHAQEKLEWVSLDGISGPGTPIKAIVSKASSDGTTFDVTVPGLWMETVSYGGKSFTRITLPAVQLGGLAFPAKEGEPGWYDFPRESGLALLPPERFVNGLQIGIPKPVFPQK